MPTNHMLYYMPGLTLDTPLSVELAAGDWHLFVQWMMTLDDTDLHRSAHIVHTITDQIMDKLYTPSSLKAAMATAANKRESTDLTQLVHNLQFADAIEKWVIRCASCGSEDEYNPEHNRELTCGHNGSRSVVRIIHYPSED